MARRAVKGQTPKRTMGVVGGVGGAWVGGWCGAGGGAMDQSTAGPCNVVKRFGSQMSGWGYSGSPDAIAFSSDTDIDVIGLVLFGSGSMDKEFTTKVRIHEGKDTSKDDDTVLVSTEFTFTAEDDDDKTVKLWMDDQFGESNDEEDDNSASRKREQSSDTPADTSAVAGGATM